MLSFNYEFDKSFRISGFLSLTKKKIFLSGLIFYKDTKIKKFNLYKIKKKKFNIN